MIGLPRGRGRGYKGRKPDRCSSGQEEAPADELSRCVRSAAHELEQQTAKLEAEAGSPELVQQLQAARDQIPRLVEEFRDYIRGAEPSSNQWYLLEAARHVAVRSRASKRPFVFEHVARSIFANLLPHLQSICGLRDEDGPSCVVVRYHDNGLFANVLQVLDALLVLRPSAPVLVNWQRQGSEGHFQYGPSGLDLFARLFRPRARCRSAGPEEAPEGAYELGSRINLVFLNIWRGYFWTLPEGLQTELRARYAEAAKALCPSSRMTAEAQRVAEGWGKDAYVVGVHKRLGTPQVAACQLCQRAPKTEEFVAKAKELLAQAGARQRCAVFLATDEVQAVEAFRAAFPEDDERVKFCCRSGVKRSVGGVKEDGQDNEVHRSPCEVVDAEDALVDALCLRLCHDLVCIDSNVALFVAVTNPKIGLHPLNRTLPAGWSEEAADPQEPVHESYTVLREEAVFVQSGPSLAFKLLRLAECGEVLPASGRAFEGWVELAAGGWVLTHDRLGEHLRGCGRLLRSGRGCGAAVPTQGPAAPRAPVGALLSYQGDEREPFVATPCLRRETA